MKSKREARKKRARRSRWKMRELGATRLTVHRTPRHMYAQIIAPEGNQVLTQASSLDASLRGQPSGNVEMASKVGALVAERAQSAGIKQVAFDRAGFKYHGRVKALADAAREGGLEF